MFSMVYLLWLSFYKLQNLPQISYSDLVKARKRYHLKRAGIPKTKAEDDVEVLQSAETTDKTTEKTFHRKWSR